MTTTTTTTFRLRAITDESITKIHLGAVEKANVTFCGVKLLVAGDTRFGGKYAKGNGYSSSTDLGTVDCGACKRTAAWKIFAATGSATIGIPAHAASKREAAPATDQAKPPSTRKRPSAAATRAAAKTAARAAAEAVSGGSVIEADPDTGLPRIKPGVQAKADEIVAAQLARNAEAGK
jgi:hypothetical protein